MAILAVLSSVIAATAASGNASAAGAIAANSINFCPPVLGLPIVESSLADPVVATQIGHRHPGLVLRQDLLFRVTFPLHRLALSRYLLPVFWTDHCWKISVSGRM
jgi:hypothetical protein